MVAKKLVTKAQVLRAMKMPKIVNTPNIGPMTANTDPVTDEDIRVLYRICLHRDVLVNLLKAQPGQDSDAAWYDIAMGKLQHTMDKMGLTCT